MSSPKTTTPPKPASSSSSSSPPPRKRFRSCSTESAMIGEGPSSSSSVAESQRNNNSTSSSHSTHNTNNSPDAVIGRRRNSNNNTTKMKIKGRRHSSGVHRGGGGRGASASKTAPEHDGGLDENDEGDEEFEGEYPLVENEGLTATLLRKIPRRTGLSKTDQEVVRLIGQHLTNIGLKTSADVLMQEAGCKLDQPSAAHFKNYVMTGQWGLAVRALEELKSHLESPKNLLEMKYLLYEQKYLEYLSQKNRLEALKVLQNELTPLQHNQGRTHELSSYLMLSKPDDINRVTRSAKSQSQTSRNELMDRLQNFLPPSIMLPPRRLDTLLHQASEYQTTKCLYHNRTSPIDVSDTDYLAVDHQCSKEDFPCETMQILTEHCEEVWYCRFSPDGLLLATGSKDMTVIIWDFDPETLSLKHNKTLERHTHGVSYFAWSPDSQRLAVCGPEDCDEICIWNVEKGEIEGKISHSTEDSLTTVSWSSDGNKITCGGNRGNFYQCDTKGVVNDSWEGVRVQCLQYRKDGKSILAADTHHRIRSYNFEDLRDASILQEDHGIMSFTLDQSDRYALLSIANQGMHLWDVEERCLIRKFTGITQGFYTIYSCFGGGPEQKFVASGSEDTKVYIYHFNRESPIAVLSGHARTVNCVDWNPVYPKVLVSASDDGTVRVWGPAPRFRTPATPVKNVNSPLSNGTAENGNSISNGEGCNSGHTGIL